MPIVATASERVMASAYCVQATMVDEFHDTTRLGNLQMEASCMYVRESTHTVVVDRLVASRSRSRSVARSELFTTSRL